MRRLILPVLSLCLSAQEPALNLSLDRVRIHPHQAWITREATWNFRSPGSQRIRLTGLPPGLSLEDIRVQAEGIPGLRLGNIGITQEEARTEPDAGTKALQTEIRTLTRGQEELVQKLGALDEAMAAITNLKPDSGATPTGQVPDPKAAVDLARAIQARSEAILAQAEDLRKEQAAVQARLGALSTSLFKKESLAKRNNSVISVELDSPAAGEARLQVLSRTGAARWRPTYEVRLGEKGLELLCYASIGQATGEDWKNVGLEISNAEPERTIHAPIPPPPVKLLYNAPEVAVMGSIEGRVTDRSGHPLAGVAVIASSDVLKPRTRSATTDRNGVFRLQLLPLGDYRLQATRAGYPSSMSFARVLSAQPVSIGIQLLPSAGGATVEVVASTPAVDHSVTNTAIVLGGSAVSNSYALEETPAHYEESGELSLAWSLAGKRDIPSDSQARRILLAQSSVEANLQLRALPRSSSEVFLVAPLRSQPGYPWFPGTPTTVFRNGEQLGQVALPRLQPGERTLFSFGPVPGIRVQRQRTEATVALARNGKSRQWTLREKVILFNDLDHEVDIQVQEPSIRSASDRVRVEVLPEATPAQEIEGDLVWHVKVPPHGQARIEEAWRILGPTTGSVPEVVALGLPTSD